MQRVPWVVRPAGIARARRQRLDVRGPHRIGFGQGLRAAQDGLMPVWIVRVELLPQLLPLQAQFARVVEFANLLRIAHGVPADQPVIIDFGVPTSVLSIVDEGKVADSDPIWIGIR